METLPKKRRLYPEHDLQVACLAWFKMQYPKYERVIYHIPNERKQSPMAGKRAKDLGTLAGVADVFLSVAKYDFHGFYIEFKSAKGKQTDEQFYFEEAILKQGYQYKIIRDFETFKTEIVKYLYFKTI